MRDAIIDLYVASFGRAPDPDGLQYWQDQYEDLDLSGVASNMMMSPEAQERFPGGLDNDELVTSLYNNLFERDPDPEGLDYWVEQMETGAMSREKAVAYIVEGARAETGDSEDAEVINAKADAAKDYLDEVEAGTREFDRQEAEGVVQSVDRSPDEEDIQSKISISDTSVTEGDSGTTTAQFTVSLDQEVESEVTVDYATSEGTATAGEDYESTSGTLAFAPGQTEQTIDVNVYGDTQDEEDETIELELSNPSKNAQIDTGTATATIEDDDDNALNPELYNTGGLRVNADYSTDIGEWYSELNTGTDWVPANILGKPNNTLEEIRQLDGKPEEAKDTIDTLYEAYMFVFENLDSASGNATTEKSDVRWEFPKPAEPAIEDGAVNCASGANVVDYLLEDNYDEVGFVWRHTAPDSSRSGGHVTNYIKDDGEYYFFDIVTGDGYPIEDGDSHFSGDMCDLIINSSPDSYVKYWSQMANDDIGVFAMYNDDYAHPLGSNHGLDSDGYNRLYYPKSYDASEMTVWYDEADKITFQRADHNPTPPQDQKGIEDLSNYEPYMDLLGVSNTNPEMKTMLTDDF